jgi:SAM-dependent methyltransferase
MHRTFRSLLQCLLMIAGAVWGPGVGAQSSLEAELQKELDTPFVVSPEEVVDRMMRAAGVGPGDVLIDLGSGDGRIVIEAVRRGAMRALGVDNDPQLVARATRNALLAGVADRTSFRVENLFETDLTQASVISFYLLPDVNRELMPRFQRLKPGTRLVSHDYGIGAWPADETIELLTPEKTVGRDGKSRVLLFIVPADTRGEWRTDLPQHGGAWRFRIDQNFQQIEVSSMVGGKPIYVRAARLRGEDIKVVATGIVEGRPWNHLFQGRVSGDDIRGELTISNGGETRKIPWTATRRQ